METPPENNGKSGLSPAGWVAILVLLGLLGVSLWYAIRVWTAMAGVHMSGWGWLFLCWVWWSPLVWARGLAIAARSARAFFQFFVVAMDYLDRS